MHSVTTNTVVLGCVIRACGPSIAALYAACGFVGAILLGPTGLQPADLSALMAESAILRAVITLGWLSAAGFTLGRLADATGWNYLKALGISRGCRAVWVATAAAVVNTPWIAMWLVGDALAGLNQSIAMMTATLTLAWPAPRNHRSIKWLLFGVALVALAPTQLAIPYLVIATLTCAGIALYALDRLVADAGTRHIRRRSKKLAPGRLGGTATAVALGLWREHGSAIFRAWLFAAAAGLVVFALSDVNHVTSPQTATAIALTMITLLYVIVLPSLASGAVTSLDAIQWLTGASGLAVRHRLGALLLVTVIPAVIVASAIAAAATQHTDGEARLAVMAMTAIASATLAVTHTTIAWLCRRDGSVDTTRAMNLSILVTIVVIISIAISQQAALVTTATTAFIALHRVTKDRDSHALR